MGKNVRMMRVNMGKRKDKKNGREKIGEKKIER